MEELDIKELLNMFWEKKVQIVAIITLFLIIGLVYSIWFVTPKYQSKTKLLLATNSSTEQQDTAITTTDITLNSKLVSTYSELVRSDKVIRAVISNLGINASESDIRNNVTVEAISNTEMMVIKVKNEDPVIAAKVTNEIATVFIENVKEYYGIENVHVVDKAEIQETPYNINHVKDIMIFVVIGIVISVVYVLIINMFDTKIKSPEEIEKLWGYTVLAAIPLYETAMRTNEEE